MIANKWGKKANIRPVFTENLKMMVHITQLTTDSTCKSGNKFKDCLWIQHFNFQLMHTTLKNVVIKTFSNKGNTPTCFGLQGNHHQGATVNTWLQLHTWFKWIRIPSHSARDTLYRVYPHTVHGTHCIQYTSHNAQYTLYTVYPHTVHGTHCIQYTLTQCTVHTVYNIPSHSARYTRLIGHNMQP